VDHDLPHSGGGRIACKVDPITAPVHSDAEIESVITAWARREAASSSCRMVVSVRPPRGNHIAGGPKQGTSSLSE
jgi:hypothetical protein